MPKDANVEALIVDGKRIPTDPQAALAQLGDYRPAGRTIDDDDEEEAPSNLEEEV